jgi:hypothetical protein
LGKLRHLLHRHAGAEAAAPAARRASLGTRSHVAWHQLELDRELAAGTSPQTSPDHEVRARQLLGRHVRRELAGCVESVLSRAEHRPHWHSAALPIQAAAVQSARAELERLHDALLDDACDSCRGVALASVLLHDGHSPIYAPGATTVSALARAATDALRADAAQPAG